MKRSWSRTVLTLLFLTLVVSFFIFSSGSSDHENVATGDVAQPEHELAVSIDPSGATYINQSLPATPYDPGVLLVKFTSVAKDPEVKQSLAADFNFSIAEELPALGVTKIEVAEGDEDALAAKLQASGLVEYAEKDYLIQALAVPNDPLYPADPIAVPPYEGQWNLEKINAPQAWDITTGTVPEGSPDVTVAVLDTGVENTHPDLQGKVIAGYDFANNDDDPHDRYGHGTHVAGIAAAATDNAEGIAGVSWGAKIMPVQVLHDEGWGFESDVAQGIIYAVDNGAKVINMSLGGGQSSNVGQTAVNYAYAHNVLVVAAAGNTGNGSLSFPASYEHVISVAATDSSDNRAYFSTYNSFVDIAAPGMSINSPVSAENYFDNGCGAYYMLLNGTSMATPHVAGLAALIASQDSNLTPDEITGILESTAVDLGSAGRDDEFGYGRIDAYAAVQTAQGSGGGGGGAGSGSGSGQSGPESVGGSVSAGPVTGHSDEDEVAPGVALVKFREGISQETMDQILADLGSSELSEVSGIGVKRISVPAGNEKSISETLRQNPAVEFAEPDFVARALLTPDDALYPADPSSRPPNPGQWNMDKIHAPEAWNTSTGGVPEGSPPVIIAVLDTGVDQSHPDLQGKLLPGHDFAYGDDDPQDRFGHGTHVAAIAAAASNNGIGVAGVSWGAQVLPVQVLTDEGWGYWSYIAEGIIYATDNGARVINISIGGSSPSSSMTYAINYAHSHGVLVVVAAGNTGNNLWSYPAVEDHVISVAATDANDATAWFSTYNAFVDIAAPGVNVMSALSTPNAMYPCTPEYKTMSGTSMASPHVAGLAALLLSVNNDLSPGELTSIIEQSAVDLGTPGKDDHYGFGRIDAQEAVKIAQGSGALGLLSGRITSSDGAPLSGANVEVFDLGYNRVAGAISDSRGYYSVSGLNSAFYRIRFDASSQNYAMYWYGGIDSDYSTAGSIYVPEGSEISGVDAALTLGGIVTGAVTDQNGLPISGVEVEACNVAWFDYWGNEIYDPCFLARTDANGTYSLTGLPTGSYKAVQNPWIHFWLNETLPNGTYRLDFKAPEGSRYVSEWYSDKASFYEADNIALSPGQTATADASLLGLGSISGRVTDQGGQPVGGIHVQLFDSSNNFKNNITTNSDGSYTFANLNDGGYKIEFAAQSGYGWQTTDYAHQFYNGSLNLASAQTITVENAQDVTGIDAQLSIGGTISGTVLNPSGQPVPQVQINIHSQDDSPRSYYVWTAVNADGTYVAKGLPTGTYTVEFEYYGVRPYIINWFDNKPDGGSADPVAVVQGSDTPGINSVIDYQAPQPGVYYGQVTGNVTNENGEPFAGVFVRIRKASNDAYVTSTHTDINGNYSLEGLATDDYKVEFLASNYIWEWYDNQRDSASATHIHIDDGQTTANVNAQMDPQGSISGTVLGPDGQPIEGIYVAICCYSDGSALSEASTNADGNYTARGLETGEYRVWFGDSFERYKEEWYNDKADYDSADFVQVSIGQNTPNVDAQLDKFGSISGRVTDEQGQSIASASVVLFNADRTVSKTSPTKADGSYSFESLPHGDYKIAFVPTNWTNFAAEWYNDKANFEDADTVSITPQNLNFTGLDSQLARQAQISGLVTDSQGQGISGVEVFVHDSSDPDSWKASTKTGSEGSYSLVGLAAGNYKLFFKPPDDSGLHPEWYENAGDFGSALTIALAAGQSLNDLNETLDVEGNITGRITDSQGQALENVMVSAFRSSDPAKAISTTWTWADGTYDLKGLDTDSYKIRFIPFSSDLLAEWYDSSDSFDSAQAIQVTGAQTVSNIDASLLTAGSIGGRLTDMQGQGISGVKVDVFDSTDARIVSSGETGTDGIYNVAGLKTGNYKVHFGGDGDFFAKWYNDADNFKLADPVSVIAGESTTGIDAQLSEKGRISGRVTRDPIAYLGEQGPQGLEDTDVYIIDAQDPNHVISQVKTGLDGTYLTEGLPDGSYKVMFTRSASTWVIMTTAWFAYQPDYQAAESITVSAGQVSTGIDYHSAGAQGGLQGWVVDSNNTPVGSVLVKVYDATDPNSLRGMIRTDGNGYFRIGLDAGDYKVKIEPLDRGLLPEWFPSTDFNNAYIFTLSQNLWYGFTDILEPGAFITGRVTGSAEAGIKDARVEIFDSADPSTPVAVARTDSSGYYNSMGLQSGNYIVRFSADDGILQPEWFDNQNNVSAATQLVLTSAPLQPLAVSGIDAILEPDLSDASFVSQSAPTHVVENMPTEVKVRFRNDGPTTWTATDGYYLSSQSGLWGTTRVDMAPGDAIAPGQEKEFVFTVTGPADPGYHDFGWQMAKDGLGAFGSPGQVQQIQVGTTSIYHSPDSYTQTAFGNAWTEGTWFFDWDGQIGVDTPNPGAALPTFGDSGIISGPDYVVEMYITSTTSTGNNAGFHFRRAEGQLGQQRHMGVFLMPDRVRLHRMGGFTTVPDTDSYTTIDEGPPQNFVRGTGTHFVKMIQQGERVRVYVDDRLYIDDTGIQNYEPSDPNYPTAGRVALRCVGTGCRYDGIRAGDLRLADKTAPVVTFTGPNGPVSPNGPVVFTATYSDPEISAGVDESSAIVSIDGMGDFPCTAANGQIGCPVTGMSSGYYSASISIADNAGNVGSSWNEGDLVYSYLMRDDATGGDCVFAGGSWDAGARTCTLNTDLTQAGISLESDGVTVDGNSHILSGHLVNINGRTNVTLKNLHLTASGGVFVTGSTNVTLQANNLEGAGIHLSGSSSTTISDNTLSGSGAINLTGSSNANTISGNHISGDHFGIMVEGSSGNNISSNEVSDYLHYTGIQLYDSDANVVAGNILRDGNCGLVIVGNSNDVYNNNFINNASHVYSEGTDNVFSHPLPEGGNHWSNWTAPDANGDGIVDAAYSFTGGQDVLPWAAASGWTLDRVAPTVSSVGPAGNLFETPTELNASYSDPSPSSGINPASVSLALNGSPLGGCTVTDTGINCPILGLAFGPYTISGSVSDNAGNTSSIGGSFQIADDNFMLTFTADPGQGTWYYTPEGRFAVDPTTGVTAVADGANGFIPGPNQTVEMDLSSVAGTGLVGFQFRRAEGSAGYDQHMGVYLSGTQIRIHRMGFSGAVDTGVPFSQEAGRSYHVKMVQAGQNIKVYVDGTLYIDDNNPQNLNYAAGGRVALRCGAAAVGCRYDNMRAMSFDIDPDQGTWYFNTQGQVAVDTTTAAAAASDGANGYIPGSNQTVEMDLGVASGTGLVGFHFRRADGSTGYEQHLGVFVNTSQIKLHRMGFSGAVDTVSTLPFTREAGRTYHVTMVQTGQNIKVYVDGTLYIDDSNPQNLNYAAGGRIGLRCGVNTGCRYENVRAWGNT